MAEITYTAQRSIVAGHSQGVEYTLSIELQEWTPYATPQKFEEVSLDGTAETTLIRIDTGYTAHTGLFTRGSSAYLQFLEFINSVIAGETFTIDAYDDTNTETFRIVGGYTPSRVGTTESFTFAFTVINE